MSEVQKNSSHTQVSTGSHLAEADYLDDHFVAMRTEYEEMLRMVGIQPGWKVLDAGCGGGSYLPLLTELVGKTGHIVAIDNAPENVDRVLSRVKRSEFNCTVEAHKADVTHLPFPDNSFDGLWNANVVQYLNEEQFLAALSEFKRVVRPGGLIAIKEFDLSAWAFGPFPSSVRWRLLATGEGIIANAMRSFELSRYFRHLGLESIASSTILSERRPPLTDAATRYFQACFPFWLDVASQLKLSDADMEVWRSVSEIDSQQHILNSKDFYWRDSHIVATGRVANK